MLIWTVQKRVYEASGIVLVPEIEFLGEFDSTLMAAKN